jgi:hypothetical protein
MGCVSPSREAVASTADCPADRAKNQADRLPSERALVEVTALDFQ